MLTGTLVKPTSIRTSSVHSDKDIPLVQVRIIDYTTLSMPACPTRGHTLVSCRVLFPGHLLRLSPPQSRENMMSSCSEISRALADPHSSRTMARDHAMAVPGARLVISCTSVATDVSW